MQATGKSVELLRVLLGDALAAVHEVEGRFKDEQIATYVGLARST